MQNYYYTKPTDDVVASKNQNYKLPKDYQIIPTSISAKLWNYIARTLAALFGWGYSRLFLKVHVKGKHKLKLVNQSGYFLYGNHTQPMGDVFTPLTIVSPYRFYAIAGQANWGIPFIGKHLVRYGGLPVGENLQESAKLIQAIKTLIPQKKVIAIYPEAHVWPYYTKIRPFSNTSMHFPVQLNVPSFTITTTYHKPKFGKRPKIIIYIDGPFSPDQALSHKKAQDKLYNKIRETMIERAQTSDYQYCHYVKK